MIKIAVLTATRAEYGLMRQLIFKLRDDPDFDLNLLVTGTHLSEHYGLTINEIIEDNIPIACKLDILCESNGTINISETMARGIELFSRHFSVNKYDLLFVDGDRYEALAVCIAAVNNHIPIAHCGGGATTEGALDEYWRHAITKLSCIHFATMELYKRRIIRMGENPQNVYVCGSPGLENIRVMKLGSKADVEKKTGLILSKPYALVTFHPATSENSTFCNQLSELLKACSLIQDMQFIFTLSNADTGGDIINKMIIEYCDENKENCTYVSSMGSYYYLTAMKFTELVLGNSSSGIIEAPSFGIPTVNIGDRQKGREKAKSIIDCIPTCEDILSAINKARSTEFKEKCKKVINPNGNGYASDIIIEAIKKSFRSGALLTKKTFFDGDRYV